MQEYIHLTNINHIYGQVAMHQERYRKEEEGSNGKEEDVWDQYLWKYQQDMWQSEVSRAEVQFPHILQIYVWIHQMWSLVKSVVNIVLWIDHPRITSLFENISCGRLGGRE